MRFESERAACEAWVATFNKIPAGLVQRAYGEDDDALRLLAGGERESDCCDAGVETGTDDDGETFPCCRSCDERCESHWSGAEHGWPASHPTLYNPSESFDQRWVRANADDIAESCGFIVYEEDETGVLLAIDGGGYNFVDAHWLPLYRLRGLRWHECEE